jgi:hypothetical protein
MKTRKKKKIKWFIHSSPTFLNKNLTI